MGRKEGKYLGEVGEKLFGVQCTVSSKGSCEEHCSSIGFILALKMVHYSVKYFTRAVPLIGTNSEFI